MLGEAVESIHAYKEVADVIESLTYLSNTLHVFGLSDQEISRWISLLAGAMNSVNFCHRCLISQPGSAAEISIKLLLFKDK